MRLIAPNGGSKLEKYLADVLGLEKDRDFCRHGNGERGGLLYFDMLTDAACEALTQRAHEAGARPVTERAIEALSKNPTLNKR